MIVCVTSSVVWSGSTIAIKMIATCLTDYEDSEKTAQGFFSAFWEHDPTPRIGNFRVVLYKIGKNTPYNKNKNIKYFVYSTSYSSLTHKQILKSDLQSDLPFVVGAQKNPLIKMVRFLGKELTYFTTIAPLCCTVVQPVVSTFIF